MKAGSIRCIAAASGVAVLGVYASAGDLCGQESLHSRGFRFARQVANAVELLDARTGTWRRVHGSHAWSTKNVSMSPTGRYIALIEVAAGVVVGHNYSVPPRGTLVILDTAGNTIRRVNRDVQRYTWFGDSRVAFVSGIYEETEMEFDATSAAIVDVLSGSVDSLPGRPRVVAWAPFDSALYLAYPIPFTGRYRIARFDPSSSSVAPTQHKGLIFSADGRFYLSFSEDAQEHPAVYRTNNDLPVSLPVIDSFGVAVRWLPSGGSHLLVRRVVTTPSRGQTPQDSRRIAFVRLKPGPPAEAEYLVYDVASRAEVRHLRAWFANWGAPEGVVPFVSGGQMNAVTRP